jgi:hypothetical protein
MDFFGWSLQSESELESFDEIGFSCIGRSI